MVQFQGQEYDLAPADVHTRMRGLAPERIREYFVEVNGSAYPVKQVARTCTGVHRQNTRESQRLLRALGFTVHRTSTRPDEPGSIAGHAAEASAEALRAELLARRDRDQQAREALGPAPSDEEWARVTAVDADNTPWIMAVIAERGWPGHSMVGEDGAGAAWLLVQHAPLEEQLTALPLLASAVARGDAAFRDFAWLLDRVRMRQQLPQIFGSQFTRDDPDDPWEVYPMEQPEAAVDVLRAAIGARPVDADRRSLNPDA